VVLGVADIEGAVGADGDAVRAAKPGLARRAAIAVVPLAAPGDGLDRAALDVEPADGVVLGIDDQDVAIGVDGQLLGRVEDRRQRRAAVAAVASGAGPGHRRDDAGPGIDRAQAAALAFEDKDRAVGGDLDRAGAEHGGRTGGPAVAGIRRLAGAGKGRDRARGEIDDAHPVVGDIGDEQKPLRRIKRQPVGLDQTRARRRSAIAGEPSAAVAGDGGNDARGAVDPAHAVIVAVGDIDVAAPVDRDAVGFVEAGFDCRAAVARIAGFAAAGDRRDDAARRVDPPDAMVEGIRKIEIAGRVEADIERPVQRRARGRPAIAGKAALAGADRRRDDPVLLRHQKMSSRQRPRS
jgi:hypothetical protein